MFYWNNIQEFFFIQVKKIKINELKLKGTRNTESVYVGGGTTPPTKIFPLFLKNKINLFSNSFINQQVLKIPFEFNNSLILANILKEIARGASSISEQSIFCGT